MCPSGLVLVKDRNAAKSSDKERVKDRWVEFFENVLNQERVSGKDIEENEKVCDTLDGKKISMREKISDSTEKDKKNYKAPGANAVVN